MLYILRHCERDMENPYFDSPLLPQGVDNAKNKVRTNLLKLEIDKIYSSPFIRCLQTIQPYTEDTNIPVTVDYNLMEWISEKIVKEDGTELRTLTDSEIKMYNVNCVLRKYDYNSKFPENAFDIKSRIQEFLTYVESDKNVLICTHECNVKEILI